MNTLHYRNIPELPTNIKTPDQYDIFYNFDYNDDNYDHFYDSHWYGYYDSEIFIISEAGIYYTDCCSIYYEIDESLENIFMDENYVIYGIKNKITKEYPEFFI